jgi:ankyrin repeat protein
MARKKTQKQKQETTLVPHRTPHLLKLLERAKSGASALAVRAYLDAGGSASVRVLAFEGRPDEQHLPLLHYMTFFSEHPHTELAECVRLLVEVGADINAKDSKGCTALLRTVQRTCCIKLLQILLQNGADIFACAPDGMTALQLAAYMGRSDSCELLIAKQSSLVHMKDASGCTALIHAVFCGSIDTVKVLCQRGADINTTDATKTLTPLMAACVHKFTEVAAFLIRAGADVNAASP